MVSSALALARQNPTPFVSAVRIVEREEALDQALLEERGGSKGCSRPLPPRRPRCWRDHFFQVYGDAVHTQFVCVRVAHPHPRVLSSRYWRRLSLLAFVAFPTCSHEVQVSPATSLLSSTV